MRVRTVRGVGSVLGKVPGTGGLCVRLDSGQYLECHSSEVVPVEIPDRAPFAGPVGALVVVTASGVQGTVECYSGDGGRLVCVRLGYACRWFDARELEAG